MAKILITEAGSGPFTYPVPFDVLAPDLDFDIDLSGMTSLTAMSTATTSGPVNFTVSASKLQLRAPMAGGFALAQVGFTWNNKVLQSQANGEIQADISPVTGVGTPVGSLLPSGVIEVTQWAAGASCAISALNGYARPPMSGFFSPYMAYRLTFRTASAPLRGGSFTLSGSFSDGTTFTAPADENGVINTTVMKTPQSRQIDGGGTTVYQDVETKGTISGQLNVITGVVDVQFTERVGNESPKPTRVLADSLRYNAVAISYLPVDAALIGIDPVRLPTDGRVPIYRAGGLAVLGHAATTPPATAVVGQPINCGRVRLSRVRVLGSDNQAIPSGYTADLEAGTVTPTNVTGWAQPVRVEHRIEDSVLIKDAQIDGTLSVTRPISHAYPLGSYVSSAFVAGDLKARVSTLFDQQTWDGIAWADALIGSPAAGTYNDTLAPIVVTNAGAVTERWALRFTSNTDFQIVGEHVGVIGTGSINADCAPINPASGQPYFRVKPLGWGVGWTGGNVLRFNTVGAQAPLWLVRTVQQGAAAVLDDKFSLLVRGDVNRP